MRDLRWKEPGHPSHSRLGRSTLSVEPQLGHVITRLQQSYPELGEGEIRAIVTAATREFDGARLRQFVPLLVERSSKAACRDLSARKRPSEPAGATALSHDRDGEHASWPSARAQ